MPCVFVTKQKFTYPVNICTVAYTGQVTFYKMPEKHSHNMYNYLPYLKTVPIWLHHTDDCDTSKEKQMTLKHGRSGFFHDGPWGAEIHLRNPAKCYRNYESRNYIENYYIEVIRRWRANCYPIACTTEYRYDGQSSQREGRSFHNRFGIIFFSRGWGSVWGS